MTKILYVASSSYSGSTLIAFLLNAHGSIVSIGHTEGWPFGADEVYLCSCGVDIRACPFYSRVREAFHEEGLAFDVRDFGTRYSLATSDRLNRYLTGQLPRLRSSRLERLRDSLVRLNPRWTATLSRQDRANRILVQTALEWSGAEVFADGAQNPHRLRHLRRIPGFDFRVVHLVRDVRGVAFSNMVKRGWDARLATRMWLRQQLDIVRVASEVGRPLVVHYEDLCENTDATLARMHELAGLPHVTFSGGFKHGEHHIMGNAMRLGDGRIVRSARWEKELNARDAETIRRIALSFADRNPGHPVSALVGHYLDQA